MLLFKIDKDLIRIQIEPSSFQFEYPLHKNQNIVSFLFFIMVQNYKKISYKMTKS